MRTSAEIGYLGALAALTIVGLLVLRAGIRFDVHEYEHDAASSSYGLEAAERLGLDPARVFKTLLASVDGELCVCVLPVASQLDLRALGQRKRISTLLDDTAFAHETIYVSAGRRGLEIELAPADLAALTGAAATRLTRAEASSG